MEITQLLAWIQDNPDDLHRYTSLLRDGQLQKIDVTDQTAKPQK
jgi:hypothetical protein